MSKKSVIIVIIIIILAAGSLLYMAWTAKTANESSNDILEEFKKIDRSLTVKKDSLQKANDSIQLNFKQKLNRP